MIWECSSWWNLPPPSPSTGLRAEIEAYEPSQSTVEEPQAINRSKQLHRDQLIEPRCLEKQEFPTKSYHNFWVGDYVLAHQQTSGERHQFKNKLSKNRLV
jgi:hypothetical protein